MKNIKHSNLMILGLLSSSLYVYYTSVDKVEFVSITLSLLFITSLAA